MSDSLHLRRFCLIALGERVPHESTVRKLTRRLGGAVVEDLTRCVIAKAAARDTVSGAGGADRLDGRGGRCALSERRSVDAWTGRGRWRARRRKLTGLVGQDVGRVRDRSSALGRRLRAISRTMATAHRGAQGRRYCDLTEPGRPTAREVSRRSKTFGRRGASSGSWPWCPSGSSQRSTRLEQTMDLRRACRGSDQAEDRRQAHHRPAGVDVRCRRSPDPQGQARQAQRVRLRVSDLRGDTRTPAAEHADSSCQRPPGPATRPRASYSPTRPSSSSASACGHARSHSTEASRSRPIGRSVRADLAPDRVFIAGRQQPGSQTNTTTARQIPHRSRGQNQPPQARATDSAAPA